MCRYYSRIETSPLHLRCLFYLPEDLRKDHTLYDSYYMELRPAFTFFVLLTKKVEFLARVTGKKCLLAYKKA